MGMARAATVIGLRVLVLGALALAAAGCKREPVGGVKPPTGFAACTPDNLALRRVSEDAATGAVTYRFENRGRLTCVLNGHAGVALAGQDGHVLRIEVENMAPPPTQKRAPKVVLRPGRRANFAVVYPKTEGGDCAAVVKLTATPPGADWGLDAPEARKLCGAKVSVTTFWYDASEVL